MVLKKKIAHLCVAAALCLFLSGCEFDSNVEQLFTLPRLPDEYVDLSMEIETLLADGYEYAAPTAGENIQSLQMEDLDGDGAPEAVLFFRRSGDEKPLKIFVYQEVEEDYALLCFVESGGSSIDSVEYADLTGDGKNELVVGWKISNEVQTAAVYNIGREAIPLTTSPYSKLAVEDLNDDGIHSLIVLRSDSEGAPIAEVFSWQTNILSSAYRCALSSTMADLSRGSVVSGNTADGAKALYVTGVDEENMAVTDVLLWHDETPWDALDGAVINAAINAETGKSELRQPYRHIAPRDINGDGVVELPDFPTRDSGGDTLAFWKQYTASPAMLRTVAQTYHCASYGWYFLLSEDWWGRVSAEAYDSAPGEYRVVLYLDGEPTLALYTLTGENREMRSTSGERFVIRRLTDTVYAAELLPGSENAFVDEQQVKSSFSMINAVWAPGE